MTSIVFGIVGVKATKWRRVKRESERTNGKKTLIKPKTEIGGWEKFEEMPGKIICR